jgi:hypothetical protein
MRSYRRGLLPRMKHGEQRVKNATAVNVAAAVTLIVPQQL